MEERERKAGEPPGITRVIVEYSNGRKYVFEGEELDTLLSYLDAGILCLHVHGWTADGMEEWDRLIEKVRRHIGIDLADV